MANMGEIITKTESVFAAPVFRDQLLLMDSDVEMDTNISKKRTSDQVLSSHTDLHGELNLSEEDSETEQSTQENQNKTRESLLKVL